MAALLGLGLLWLVPTLSLAAAQAGPAPSTQPGSIEAMVCPLVESAAQASHVPIGLLTRLFWVESRFRAHVTSPKGAQGIAQFMPGTAVERGLADPFDPEQAVPKAARLLADLAHRFGNFGLAAAAYNAGANRVADWLAGSATLPAETRVYVVALTGVAAEDWMHNNRQPTAAGFGDTQSCAEVTAALRAGEGIDTAVPIAPWGVQLSGNFSKAVALASFTRAQQRYAGFLGNLRPMVLGNVLRSRGTRPFYRVLLPEASRAEADHTCQAILSRGGACVTVRT